MLVARNRRPKMLGAPSFPLSRVGLQRVHKGAASVGLTGPNGVMHVLGSRTPMPVRLGAVAWYNFTDSSKLIGGAAPTTDVAGWKDSISELNPSQLLTNPEFGTDVSGWSNTDNTVVWNNGIAEITSTVSGGFSSIFKQNYSTNQSGWYNLNLKVTKVDNPFFKVFILPFGANSPRPITIDLKVGTYNEPFYYDSTVGTGTGFSVYFELSLPNIGEQLFLDYVRLKSYVLPPYNLSQSSSSAQPVFTQPNGPVVFDGSDYLEESTESLTFAGDMTFAFRFKQDVGAPNFGNLLSTKASATGPSGIHIEIVNKTQINIRGSSSTQAAFGGLNDLEASITNIIIKVTGTTIELFQGGISKGTGTIDAVVANTEPLRLGTINGTGNFFDGDMYEVSCFQRALTDSEVLQLNSWMDR